MENSGLKHFEADNAQVILDITDKSAFIIVKNSDGDIILNVSITPNNSTSIINGKWSRVR